MSVSAKLPMPPMVKPPEKPHKSPGVGVLPVKLPPPAKPTPLRPSASKPPTPPTKLSPKTSIPSQTTLTMDGDNANVQTYTPKQQKQAAIKIQSAIRTWKARKEYKDLYEKRKWTLHKEGNQLTNHVTKNRVSGRPGRRPPTRGKRVVGLAKPTNEPARVVNVPEEETTSSETCSTLENCVSPSIERKPVGGMITGGVGGMKFDPTAVKLKSPTPERKKPEDTGPSRSPIQEMRSNLRPSTMAPRPSAPPPVKSSPMAPLPSKAASESVLSTPPPPKPAKPAKFPPPRSPSPLAEKSASDPNKPVASKLGPSKLAVPSKLFLPMTPPPVRAKSNEPPSPSRPRTSSDLGSPTSLPPIPPKKAVPIIPEFNFADLDPSLAHADGPIRADGPTRALSPRGEAKKKRITTILNNFIPKRPSQDELIRQGVLQPEGGAIDPAAAAAAIMSSKADDIEVEFVERTRPRVSASAICLNPKCCKSLKKSNKRDCKRCGKVYCKDCLNKKQALPEMKYSKPVNICDLCFHARRKEELELKANYLKSLIPQFK